MNLTNGIAMNSYNNQANQQSRNNQHSRTVSLPAFSLQAAQQQQQQQQQTENLSGLGANIGSYSHSGYGLGVSNEGTLHGWAEEEVA